MAEVGVRCGPPYAIFSLAIRPAKDVDGSPVVHVSPLAESACRVHDCADADIAHKMRPGCDLRGFLGSTFKPFQELKE
jgi:hypothetical protein